MARVFDGEGPGPDQCTGNLSSFPFFHGVGGGETRGGETRGEEFFFFSLVDVTRVVD